VRATTSSLDGRAGPTRRSADWDAAGRRRRGTGEAYLDRDIARGEHDTVLEDLRQPNITDVGTELMDLLFVSLRILHDGHWLAGFRNDDSDEQEGGIGSAGDWAVAGRVASREAITASASPRIAMAILNGPR